MSNNPQKMASILSKRKLPRSEKRARALVRDGVKKAGRLTFEILREGTAPLTQQKDQVPKPNRRKPKPKAPGKHSARAARTVQVAPEGLKANVTGKLAEAAPAFGQVLLSIAHAVAVTQTALDETALESLKTLARQPVDIPVLVEQTLSDDGVPTSVKVTTARMPLTSVIRPSMQAVNQMTLRIDMQMQSFDATNGIKFNQNMFSAGVSYSGHSFGFAVGMNNTNINAQFANMSDFSSGSVMMSMDIVDRTGFEIPEPNQYGIGANLLVRLSGITQTATTNPDGFERIGVWTIRLVKTTGAMDNQVTVDDVITPPGLLPTVSAGSLQIKRVCESAADPYLERKVSVRFGQLVKEISFYL